MPQFSFSEYELIRVEVFWVSLVGIWLLYSLLAFWMATSDWHWFLRAALLAVATSVLKAIEADDLILMQLFNSITVFALLIGWRTFCEWKATPELWRGWKKRFSLANLMLGVALLAFLLSIARTEIKDLVTPVYSIGFGCAVGLAFVAGVGVTRIKSRWAMIAAVLTAGLGIYNAYHWAFPKLKYSSLYYAINPTSFIWGPRESFAKAILAAMAVSGLAVGYLHQGGRRANFIGAVFTRVGCGLVALAILLLAVSTIDLGSRLSFWYPPQSLQSEESQLDKLLPFADRFESSQVFSTYPEPAETILRKELIAYNNDFESVRAVLDTPEAVPLPYHMANYSGEMGPTPRSIARALSKKAQFEFADGQVDQSLSNSALIIRLREPTAGNMLLVWELVALGIEGIGHYSVAESIPDASRQAIAEALKHLLEIDARINDPESIYENDQAVGWRTTNWHGRLRMLCDSSSTREMFDDSIRPAIHRGDATRKQVIAMLALELHRHDKGDYPPSLQALVPQYLDAALNDPFAFGAENVPLKYKALDNGADYLLYSVGFNQQDDGGKLHELGYAFPYPDDVGDLNLQEAAQLDRLKRDAEVAQQAGAE